MEEINSFLCMPGLFYDIKCLNKKKITHVSWNADGVIIFILHVGITNCSSWILCRVECVSPWPSFWVIQSPPPPPGSSVCVMMVPGKEKKDGGWGGGRTKPTSPPGKSGPVPCNFMALWGLLSLWSWPVLEWKCLYLSHYLKLFELWPAAPLKLLNPQFQHLWNGQLPHLPAIPGKPRQGFWEGVPCLWTSWACMPIGPWGKHWASFAGLLNVLNSSISFLNRGQNWGWRIDAFRPGTERWPGTNKLWNWRLLRVPWTARRSNQSVL